MEEMRVRPPCLTWLDVIYSPSIAMNTIHAVCLYLCFSLFLVIPVAHILFSFDSANYLTSLCNHYYIKRKLGFVLREGEKFETAGCYDKAKRTTNNTHIPVWAIERQLNNKPGIVLNVYTACFFEFSFFYSCPLCPFLKKNREREREKTGL
jgi:hypothetical protein